MKKKLRIPNKPCSLEINGHDYRVRFIEGDKAQYGTDDVEILGAISMRNCEIIVEREMKDSKILEVLTHEVLHAITYGTSLAIQDEKVEDTMLDLINYSVILMSYYMYEQNFEENDDSTR